MEGDKLKLNVKMMNSTLSVEVAKGAKVLDLKKQIKEQTQAAEDEQKIIYKGSLSAGSSRRQDPQGRRPARDPQNPVRRLSPSCCQEEVCCPKA
ncbi:MAG: ubiquitin family protein [Acidobacteriaceae bacterium]|nr:ubiquitin family protein [Acidobacteriaceae bacterium]